MKAAPLNNDHVLDLDLHTETTQYLREHGYSCSITDYYSVVSESGNGYIVYTIRTHEVPFKDADAVADQLDLVACNCSDFRFNSGLPDLEEKNASEYSLCKHGKHVQKHL